jgi:small-conductance mechanosensitive channel
MPDEFSAAERLLSALAIVPAVFFVTMGVGRFLKRRVGVKLGLMFKLFSMALAIYVALSVSYGDWGGVIKEVQRGTLAAVILLGSFFLVALFRRFLWEGYFERRRKVQVPNFVREVLALILFLIALVIVMDQVYDLSIKGIVAGSGVAAIILGLAMQDLLGNIVAGVSLEVGRPFKVGDWLKVEGEYGQVTEMNWRSVRLRTNDEIHLDIPNNEIVKHKITNLNHPTKRYAMRLEVGIDYNVPPNVVKDILVRAATNATHALETPQPKAFLLAFGDSSIQ